MTSGLAAFFYLGLLWYAAPAFSREQCTAAQRLRVVALCGIAIPGALALVHLLYAPLLWIAAAALAAWRLRKKPPAIEHDGALYATLGAVLLVVWPPLVRPLLDGDSLLYHLPNAVAFAQAHSFWTAPAPYWPYPPASELFASGLFVASGRWSMPLAGVLPALLIAARIYAVAREHGARRYAASAAALAFVCTPVAAFQAGTLQNDLWLAAFFAEVLSCADRSWVSLAICALLKPYGWIEGLIAAAATRVSFRTFAVSLLPLLAWILRDIVLALAGTRLGFSPPPYWPSTIAGNAAIAFTQLAHGIALTTPQAFVWIALLLAGWFAPASRRYAAAGVAACALYVLLPVSYSNGVTNYVLDASSLRYALPALACGALVGAALCSRAAIACAIAGYALAAWGTWSVLTVFWNDGYAHYALLAAALGAIAGGFCRPVRGALPAALVLAVLLFGSWGASSRAAGFYADWMRQPSGKPTAAFDWIAAHRPAQVIALNLREGAVLMSSPGTRVTGASTPEVCEQAREQHALLVAGSNETLAGEDAQALFARLRDCGTVRYEDGAAIIVQTP